VSRFLPYGNSRLPFQDPLYVWTLPQDFNWRVQFSPICGFCCPLYSRYPRLLSSCPLLLLRFGTTAPFKATICLYCLVIVSISTVVIFRRNRPKTSWPFCLLNPQKNWFQLHQNYFVYALSCHLKPKSDSRLNIELCTYTSPRTKRRVLLIEQNLANPSIVYPLAKPTKDITSQEEIFELLNNWLFMMSISLTNATFVILSTYLTKNDLQQNFTVIREGNKPFKRSNCDPKFALSVLIVLLTNVHC
jgi:hypothetical protein